MKFKVREGFVVHVTKNVEVGGQKQSQTTSYYSGQECDFDEKTATEHMHKLEPVCKKAGELLASKHPAVASAGNSGQPVFNLPQIDYALLAAAMIKAQQGMMDQISNGETDPEKSGAT